MTPELASLFVERIGRPDPTILDIGCNDGTDTMSFIRMFPQAAIYCFEPDRRAQWRFFQKTKGTRNLVRMMEAVVCAVDGEVDFYPSYGAPNEQVQKDMPYGWDFSGSIRKPKEHLRRYPWCHFSAPVKVRSVRLDTFTLHMGIEMIDLIWADVQGAEGDLISGGLESLTRTRFLFTEIYNAEMYAGQINERQLLDRLPMFEKIWASGDDILLKNRGY